MRSVEVSMLVVMVVLLTALVLLLIAVIIRLVVPLLTLAVLMLSLLVIVVLLPLLVVLLVAVLAAVVLILFIVMPLILIVRPLVARVLIAAGEVRICRHGGIVLLILLMRPRALVVVILACDVTRVFMMLVALVAPIMLLIVLTASARVIWKITLVLRKVLRAEVRLSRIATLKILLEPKVLMMTLHRACFVVILLFCLFLEFFTVKFPSLILNLPLLRFLVVVARLLNIFSLPVTILSLALATPVCVRLSLHLTVLMVIILAAVLARSAVSPHLVG